METCSRCKQPLKANGRPHTVPECAEMLHRALDAALLQISAMRPVVEAAITWKRNEKWPYLQQGGHLAHAIDAYEKSIRKELT